MIELKKYIIAILLIIFCSNIFSQQLMPNVLATSGSTFITSSIQWDFTIGEPSTITFDNGLHLFTQGFHQAEINITEINLTEVTNVNISVFPNPTNSYLSINGFNKNSEIVINIYSYEGKLLVSNKMLGAESFNLDLTYFAQGFYFLDINENTNTIKRFKIIKN